MELWGDPAVMALIDCPRPARNLKRRAEIEGERSHGSVLAAIRPRQRRPWAYTPASWTLRLASTSQTAAGAKGSPQKQHTPRSETPRKDCSCPKSMPITDPIIALLSET